MPYIKIEYGSSHNISVSGVDYFEVSEDELDDEGFVPQRLVDETWQEAVNEYMSDTWAGVVWNEGD